jgi:glycine/D-amino acid oxidase-like deaminating enzyme
VETTSESEAHVVVVGAGVIGCAVAHALAPVAAVTVVERDRIGAGATGRSAGEVTMAPSYSDRPAIADYATSFFRANSGQDGFTFHERESVEFVPPDRLGEARRRVARLAETGLETEFMGQVDAGTAYPVLDLSEHVGLVRHRNVGFLDPTQLVGYLAARARDHGAAFRTGTEVTDIQVRDGTVRGVRTTAGRIDADAVVVAAGWRTPALVAPWTDLPVRPYRTQAAVVDIPSVRDWHGDLPMGWLPGDRVYFRPMGRGEVLVGGFAEPVEYPARASRDADPTFRRHVAELIPRRFADAEGARLVDSWAGVDLATPDTRPLIDSPAGGPSGLVVATGFHGRGVMTAPVGGAAVRAQLTGEAAPFPLGVFALDRFETDSPDFPFLSTSSGREL